MRCLHRVFRILKVYIGVRAAAYRASRNGRPRHPQTSEFSACDTVISDAIGSELKRDIDVWLYQRSLLPFVVKAGQNASNQIHTGKTLVVSANDVPRRYRCVSP